MIDVNGQYYGQLFGQDRIGQTTPDLESSEWLRPWLPVAYPAPYLPTLRQDQGHPKLASIVMGAHQLVGQDKNGGLVPAGLYCGTQATKALGGTYCVIAYSPADVKFAFNAQTSARVTAAGQYAVLAAPSDGVAGDQVTLPSGQVITIQAADLAFALTCDLFTTGRSRPIGAAVRNVYQYIGGVLVGQNTNPASTTSATGINYVLDGVVPINFVVMNYMHEMGTAIQTQFALKLPWIGESTTALQGFATTDGIVGYVQGIGRSFTHFTGVNSAAGFSFGSPVVASSQSSGTDAGNYTTYNPAVNSPGDIIGRVIGIQNLNPVGFLNRVRTQFDRPMVGPMVDPNPMAIRMGGSATRGLPYHVHVTTDGAFVFAVDQQKTLRPEYTTHIIVRVNL